MVSLWSYRPLVLIDYCGFILFVNFLQIRTLRKILSFWCTKYEHFISRIRKYKNTHFKIVSEICQFHSVPKRIVSHQWIRFVLNFSNETKQKFFDSVLMSWKIRIQQIPTHIHKKILVKLSISSKVRLQRKEKNPALIINFNASNTTSTKMITV